MKFILSNIYRTPTQSNELTQNFVGSLDTHLNNISNMNKNSIIFLDSNIDLLKLNEQNLVSNYFNTILSIGFNQVIGKATRMQGTSHSLIDHILVNSHNVNSIAGTLISDISDHFITFFAQAELIPNSPVIAKTTRKITDAKINTFREALNCVGWGSVLAKSEVDQSFEDFWGTFKILFDLHFPVTAIKFN